MTRVVMDQTIGTSLGLLADAYSPTQWVVLAVAVAATAFVLFRPKYRKKKDPLDRSPTGLSLAQQRSVERQMQNLLVELSEMAREVSAGLDNRAAKLQALIQDADQRIAALKALPSAPTDRPADASAELQSAGTAAEAPSPYDDDPRHAEVYALAESGYDAAAIAARLNRPSGEIQLILALRPREATRAAS